MFIEVCWQHNQRRHRKSYRREEFKTFQSKFIQSHGLNSLNYSHCHSGFVYTGLVIRLWLHGFRSISFYKIILLDAFKFWYCKEKSCFVTRSCRDKFSLFRIVPTEHMHGIWWFSTELSKVWIIFGLI